LRSDRLRLEPHRYLRSSGDRDTLGILDREVLRGELAADDAPRAEDDIDGIPAESSELRASPTTMLRPDFHGTVLDEERREIPACLHMVSPVRHPSTPPLMEMSIPASWEQSSTTPFISMLSVALMEKTDTDTPLYLYAALEIDVADGVVDVPLDVVHRLDEHGPSLQEGLHRHGCGDFLPSGEMMVFLPAVKAMSLPGFAVFPFP
jgi:hypothetical protein